MKEYGGYLPLEIKPGKEYYYDCGKQKVKRLNSGKAAIYYVLRSENIKKIYIPHYICSSVVKIAKKAGVEIERYYIDKDFAPIDIALEEQEIILVVNYFGITYQMVEKLSRKYSRIIIDNTQAFFAKPIIREGVYNVYSCKKFIGVPDGGYLVGRDLKEVSLEQDYSSENMNFCLQSIEHGTAYAYESKKMNDLRFLNEIKKMSIITRKLLEGVDYSHIIKTRKCNFNLLDNRLGKYNRFNFKGLDFVPYYYPLYLEKGIQKQLIEKKVYVPILWRELLENNYEGTVEMDYSKNIVFLPLDQRYSEKDILEICSRVEDCMGKENE